MKTTDDIIDELRLAATSDPAPAGLSGLLAEAADRLDNLFASGIHTCHANCQRPMCVLRRKLKAAQAELAQAQESLASSRSAHDAVVKASQDEHQELVERRIAASKHSNEYNEQFFRAERLQQEQKAADAEFEQLRASLARVTSDWNRLGKLCDEYEHTQVGLRRGIARVTAERDGIIGVKDRAVLSAAENKQEADDLRAHIADLEAAASLHWIAEEELKQARLARDNAKTCEAIHFGTVRWLERYMKVLKIELHRQELANLRKKRTIRGLRKERSKMRALVKEACEGQAAKINALEALP